MAKEQTVAYLLTRLDDIIPEILPSIHQHATVNHIQPWTSFAGLLSRQDMFIAHMSAKIVTKIITLSFPTYKIEGADLDFFFGWLRSQLATDNHDYLQSTVMCLQKMLRLPYYRAQFFDFGGMDCLRPLLSDQYGFQLQYQVCNCIWLMSYSKEIALGMSKFPKVLPALADVLKTCQKEKVLRMIIAIFVNLLKSSQDDKKLFREYTMLMIQGKVVRSLELIIQTHCNTEKDPNNTLSNLQSKDEVDEDLLEDCEFLDEQLSLAVQNLSSIDEYRSELLSGRLEWSPVHKSPKFWRENGIFYKKSMVNFFGIGKLFL